MDRKNIDKVFTKESEEAISSDYSMIVDFKNVFDINRIGATNYSLKQFYDSFVDFLKENHYLYVGSVEPTNNHVKIWIQLLNEAADIILNNDYDFAYVITPKVRDIVGTDFDDVVEDLYVYSNLRDSLGYNWTMGVVSGEENRGDELIYYPSRNPEKSYSNLTTLKERLRDFILKYNDYDYTPDPDEVAFFLFLNYQNCPLAIGSPTNEQYFTIQNMLLSIVEDNTVDDSVLQQIVDEAIPNKSLQGRYVIEPYIDYNELTILSVMNNIVTTGILYNDKLYHLFTGFLDTLTSSILRGEALEKVFGIDKFAEGTLDIVFPSSLLATSDDIIKGELLEIVDHFEDVQFILPCFIHKRSN